MENDGIRLVYMSKLLITVVTLISQRISRQFSYAEYKTSQLTQFNIGVIL